MGNLLGVVHEVGISIAYMRSFVKGGRGHLDSRKVGIFRENAGKKKSLRRFFQNLIAYAAGA